MTRFLAESRTLIQHIPRTGGTWIEKALDVTDIKVTRWVEKQPKDIPKKHALLGHFYRDQLPNVDFIVAFVRHPTTYYRSVYKWVRSQRHPLRKEWRWHPHQEAVAVFERGMQYRDWLWLMLRKHPQWYTRLVQAYVGPQGGEIVNFIGRNETLFADFCKLLIMRGHGDSLTASINLIESMERKNAIDMELETEDDSELVLLEQERLVIERFYSPSTQGKRLYVPVASKTASA